MIITLSPIRADHPLTLSRQGDVLVVNGTALDLSGVAEGARLEQAALGCEWLASDVERVGGRLKLTLLLPHGANVGPETLFPVSVASEGDGEIALPAYELPAPLAPTDMGLGSDA